MRFSIGDRLEGKRSGISVAEHRERPRATGRYRVRAHAAGGVRTAGPLPHAGGGLRRQADGAGPVEARWRGRAERVGGGRLARAAGRDA